MTTTVIPAFDGQGGITNVQSATALDNENQTSLKEVILENDKSDHIHIVVLKDQINSLLGTFSNNASTDDFADDGSFNAINGIDGNANLFLAPTFLGDINKCRVLSSGIKPIQSELETFKERVGELLTSGQEAVFNMDNFQNSTISNSDVQTLLSSAGGQGFVLVNVNSHLRAAIDDGYNGRDATSQLITGFHAQDDIIIEGQNPVTGSVQDRGLQIRLALAQKPDPDGLNTAGGDGLNLDFEGVITAASNLTKTYNPVGGGSPVNFAISNYHTVRLQVLDAFPL